MLTPNGPSPCTCKANPTLTEAAIEAGDFTAAYPESYRLKLMELIYFHGATEMAQSLRLVHDLALYQSEVPLDRQEKDALYDVIALSKVLGQVESS